RIKGLCRDAAPVLLDHSSFSLKPAPPPAYFRARLFLPSLEGALHQSTLAHVLDDARA
ncbi:hypothetical protein ACLOJK_025638, partial [Asimina triloba]